MPTDAPPSAGELTQRFELNRERLRRLAYRLLGTVDDADDVVQEVYLRWHDVDARELRSPDAWLTTVVTRLCIDRQRASRRERASYTGAWLPEPLYVTEPLSPDHRLDRTSDLSMALLVLLERLSPEERAVYLLHDVFDFAYEEIAAIVGATEAACRQRLHRARKRVQESKPRLVVADAARRGLIMKFLHALQTADHALLIGALSEDATITSDGGGNVKAALNVVHGADRIARLLLGVRRKTTGAIDERLMSINGEPGIVVYVDGAPRALFVFAMTQTRICAIYRVVNPSKLRTVPPHRGLARVDDAQPQACAPN